MAKLAHKSLKIWKELERDAGTTLRSMTGLLNFGDPKTGEHTPEGQSTEETPHRGILSKETDGYITGTLMGPKDNLIALKMPFRESMSIIIDLLRLRSLHSDDIHSE